MCLFITRVHSFSPFLWFYHKKVNIHVPGIQNLISQYYFCCEMWKLNKQKNNYRNTCIRLLFIKQNFGHIVRKRLNGNFVYIHLSVQMYSLALIYNSLISLYECISYTATLPSLRTRGYNSLQNMLLKLMIQMFTMPWCVLPNLFAHPIADMKLHLSKNNNIVLTKFTFEFFQLVTDNSVSWRHSLEAVNFWIPRIPNSVKRTTCKSYPWSLFQVPWMSANGQDNRN